MVVNLDELLLFRGKDYVINDKISIHHPTLNEIADYGEQEYYGLVSRLTCVPSDYKVQLFDMGVDYEEISEFDMFALMCNGLEVDETYILFGDLNFAGLKLMQHNNTGEMMLYNYEQDFVIDRCVYEIIVEYLRKIHGFEKNIEMAGNKYTKQILIDEARNLQEQNKNKPYKSMLIPLISALTNTADFKYSHSTVWDLPIYVFMDSVKRIQKIKNYNYLMQGAYSGNVDTKKISKDELNWLGELK